MKNRPLYTLVVTSLFALQLSACSKKAPTENPRPTQTLSAVELAAVDALNPNDSVKLAVLGGDGSIRSLSVRAGDVRDSQAQAVAADPQATIIVDDRVNTTLVEEPIAYKPDEALIFGGKQEFGFDVWEAEHPEADGRGVTIGVVDDGVALGRPGLLTTSTDAQKIAKSLNMSSEWQLALSADTSIDVATASPLDLTAVPELKFEGAKGHVLNLTGCGIKNSTTRKPRACESWEDQLGSQKSAPALVVHDGKVSNESIRIAVDFDHDGKISKEEVFLPLSVDSKSIKKFSNGSALAFDVIDAGTLGLSNVDSRTRVLMVAVPQLSKLTPEQTARGLLVAGSHGEGVAGVAAGYRIAGRQFNGVAPGAQIADVHFTDPVGSSQYTISEIARALKAAGKISDVVNLSYSLFFNSPATQVAMGRFLEEALKKTEAVYLFSAGNNGPGIGSMNRALLYPSFGIPVAAFLNGTMAQTTFGSALPMAVVAPYSSVGPGFDGGTSAIVLSPLAGIVPSTPDEGFRPFSGTSSATPALAGFVARLISQIKAEKLPIDRAKIRASLVASAEPIAGASYIEQGRGIPKLKAALEDYRRRVSSKRMVAMKIQGSVNAYGVARKGIYVRGAFDRADQYLFSIGPSFDASFSEADRANYSERVDLSSKASWLQFPKSLFVSREGASFNVAVDWDRVKTLGSGLIASEIEIRSPDRSETLAVVPVTIIVPHSNREKGALEVDVKPAAPTRIFVNKPQWATHLVVAREIVSTRKGATRLCGRAALYNPSSVRSSLQVDSVKADGALEEYAFETPGSGIYEWVVEGRLNHQACAKKQKQAIRYQWVQAQAIRLEAAQSSSGPATLSGRWALSTRAQALFGSPRLEGFYVERELNLASSTPGYYQQTDETDFSAFANFQVRLSDSMIQGRESIAHYPYYGLEIEGTRSSLAPVSVEAGDFGQIGGMTTPMRFDTDADQKEFSSAKLGVIAFESGIDSSDLPRLLKVTLVGQLQKPASKTGTNLRLVEVRSGQPAMLDYAFGALEASVSTTQGLMARCRFVPRGFSVSVPCGWVRF